MRLLRAGSSHSDITPPVGTPLEGYIERRGNSTGVHDKLTAKAIVLEGADGNRIAVVSCDLVGVGRWVIDYAREKIQVRTDIKSNNVMVAATHTHSGPRGVVDFFTGEDVFAKGLFDRKLSESVGNGIIEAVVNANRRLREAKIGLGRGNVAGLFSNRRSPDGPFDPELAILEIDALGDKQLIGCAANYACHPTVLGPSNLLFSADFPAYAADTVLTTVKKKVGEGSAEVLFLNGAAGNVSTRFTRREATFGEAERIGRALGVAILKVMQGIGKMSSDISISTASEIIKLPQRKLPSLDFVKSDLMRGEEILRQLKTSGADSGQIRVVESMTEGAKGLIAAYGYAKQFEGREFDVEIQVFRIGDVVTLCAVPAEMFVEFGLQVKRKLRKLNPLMVGYANGFIGYVLTEEAYREGGYESLSTFLEPNAGTRIVETVERLSEKLSTK
jgi:neutral ceramidase